MGVLVGKTLVVAADRLWEHIPAVGLMVVENKRCGERWIDTHLWDKYLKEVLSIGDVDKAVDWNLDAARSIKTDISARSIDTPLDENRSHGLPAWQFQPLGGLVFLLHSF
ncbi:hypothetical protein Tco_1028618 [Tanacetum coccineum]|uniref:Uncharacterized protein n=1 Tax=Tanacetum coccineum TaxID=301880 RepID=A0ABQ5G168_9ASTR